jgi:hypothetical protein
LPGERRRQPVVVPRDCLRVIRSVRTGVGRAYAWDEKHVRGLAA